MAIQIGAPVPDVELKVMSEERPESVCTGELFQDKRVVLFALPGAFTPTCSKLHLPGY
ncbi:MAG TPA: peroxiredoxin, partial [Gammaproteobacteria bacterium]|nr:peroxiredoxin [Gammaproteobacteria bacterium]